MKFCYEKFIEESKGTSLVTSNLSDNTQKFSDEFKKDLISDSVIYKEKDPFISHISRPQFADFCNALQRNFEEDTKFAINSRGVSAYILQEYNTRDIENRKKLFDIFFDELTGSDSFMYSILKKLKDDNHNAELKGLLTIISNKYIPDDITYNKYSNLIFYTACQALLSMAQPYSIVNIPLSEVLDYINLNLNLVNGKIHIEEVSDIVDIGEEKIINESENIKSQIETNFTNTKEKVDNEYSEAQKNITKLFFKNKLLYSSIALCSFVYTGGGYINPRNIFDFFSFTNNSISKLLLTNSSSNSSEESEKVVKHGFTLSKKIIETINTEN